MTYEFLVFMFVAFLHNDLAPAFFPIPSRISCPHQPHQHGRKGLGKILVRIRGRTWGSCLFVCVHLCVCAFFSQAQDWHITVNITLQPCSVAVAAPSVEVQVQASTQLMGGRNHTMLGCHWARVVKFRSNQKQLCSKCTKTPNPTPWKGNAKYRFGML